MTEAQRIKILKTLLQELWIHSDNCKLPIERMWFPIQEVIKITNSPRDEVMKIFNLFIHAGYLIQKSSEPLLFEFTPKGKLLKSDHEIGEVIRNDS